MIFFKNSQDLRTFRLKAVFCLSLVFVFWGSFAPFASAQSEAPSEPTAQNFSFTPDVFVNVKEYNGGPEMVSITALKDGIPGDYLREQCLRIAANLGSEARGLSVVAADLGTSQGVKVARASFGTDHLIDRATGAINLEAIAKAFTGFSEPYLIDSIVVTLEGEQPGMKTLKSLDTLSVNVVSQVLTDPSGLEYRVFLKTQNPNDIEIPSLVEDLPEKVEKTTSSETVNPWVFILLGLGALSAGALVYFVALRSGFRR